MPFVQRIVEPKYLSRTSLWDDEGNPRVTDYELDAVTNNTLSNALRQLASLVLAANDIFTDLGDDLQKIARRSQELKTKMTVVEEKIATFDPKKVTVPESDICSFAELKKHYETKHDLTTNLFSSATRPNAVRELYEAAAKTPIHLMRQMDKWRRDGHRSSKFFLCTPVLGRRRKTKNNVNIEIETRMPAVVEVLRRWTSNEALGDMTISTECQNRIPTNCTTFNEGGDTTDGTVLSDDEAIDHKLPSPEEQQHVIALKFPPEVVTIDISGRNFDRMSVQRRSMLNAETEEGGTIRRRSKNRRSRSKRRNTIAGTDEKEIVDALAGGEEATSSTQHDVSAPPAVGAVNRSKSSDLLRSTKKESPETKKSHFDSLKQWGKNKLKSLNKYTDSKSPENKKEEENNLYETITVKRKRSIEKERKTFHQRQPSCSSSEKSSLATPQVKLRDSSLQRRLRRSGENKEEPHSSSGNWSASSESGRASIGSEITTHPKSTTSAATSSNSLNIHPPGSANSRRRYITTSTSGSVTSEGTLTPDIIHDLHEDGETSSVYSCDTEGYYTSFHMDSGLKTLKEEEGPQTPLHSTTVFTNSSSNSVLTAENEYELFGRGSTSTTTSSAGTVCTTLRASESNRSLTGPAVPERKSSLYKERSPESSLERDCSTSEKTGTVKRSPLHNKATVVAVIHKHHQGDVSPDSGHNTSSSPIESIYSPNGVRSCSEFEFSESSDMEGADRIERIRVKTTINSSRIPSMCAITPPQSDDESIKNFDTIKEKNQINQKMIQETNFDVEAKETNLDHLDILRETKTTTTRGTSIKLKVNIQSGYATIENIDPQKSVRSASPSGGTVIVKEMPKSPQSSQPIFRASLLPLNNMLGKLKTNWNNLSSKKPSNDVTDDGDYVTIADVKNNNDMINRNLKTVLSGKIKETEYVSLNELPTNDGIASDSSLDRKRRHGARVTLNADGKVVYSSDSLPRRKGATTFEPGPFVKAKSPASSPVATHRNVNIRPLSSTKPGGASRPMSPKLGKVVIRASSGMQNSSTSEVVRMQPSTIVRPMSPKPISNTRGGAYVHMLDSQTKEEGQPHSPPGQFENAKMMETSLHRNEVGPYNTLPARRNPLTLNEPDITRDLGSRRFDTVGRISNDPRQGQHQHHRSHNFGIPVQMPSISHGMNFKREPLNDSLKISPIDPRNVAGFKSSTPSVKPSDSKSAINLDSLLLSPKKSTMSNDELYAVIHKSKKKLNINEFEAADDRDDTVKQKIQSPETGYLGKAKSRMSWSPSSSNATEINKEVNKSPKNESRPRQSWATTDKKGNPQTARLDFKRLLLQHCKPNLTPTTNKLSAVEQLKLSKQQIQTQKSEKQDDISILELSRSPRSLGNRKMANPSAVSSPRTPEKVRPAPKILSPRSQWRFASPRSDVLSSTILEDCREDDSPNSSTERRKTPQIRNQNVQESTNNVDNKYKTIGEKIQARRAQFFNTGSNYYTNRENPEKPVLPTLETAF